MGECGETLTIFGAYPSHCQRIVDFERHESRRGIFVLTWKREEDFSCPTNLQYLELEGLVSVCGLCLGQQTIRRLEFVAY
jgi:hypothetical protein